MRHLKKGRKLNRTSSHRKALFSNLASSLVINKRIITTHPKAKELQKFVERLITYAKYEGDKAIHGRRLIQKRIVGKNTIEALRSGFYWGYLGLINNIIMKIQKETKKKYKIVFTGGYADLFKTSIIRPFAVDRNITIKGIIEIFKENKKYLTK